MGDLVANGLGQSRVLAWRMSNTMDRGLRYSSRDRSQLHQYRVHGIVGDEPGYAARRWTVAVGVWTTIERLWRSLKYEAVYARSRGRQKAQRVIGEWMEFYNEQRPHSELAGRTPEEASDGAAKREEGVA